MEKPNLCSIQRKASELMEESYRAGFLDGYAKACSEGKSENLAKEYYQQLNAFMTARNRLRDEVRKEMRAEGQYTERGEGMHFAMEILMELLGH